MYLMYYLDAEGNRVYTLEVRCTQPGHRMHKPPPRSVHAQQLSRTTFQRSITTAIVYRMYTMSRRALCSLIAHLP